MNNKPAAATHIKETAVQVRKFLVVGELTNAMAALHQLIDLANELKKAIADEAEALAPLVPNAPKHQLGKKVAAAVRSYSKKVAVAAKQKAAAA
jgi:hypothetical protein